MSREQLFSVETIAVWYQQYRYYVMSVAVLAVLGVGGGYYYVRQRTQMQTASFEAFFDLLQQVDKAKNQAVLWDEVVFAAQAGYRQFSRSNLAPYFLCIEADALTNQDQLESAIEKMGRAILLMDKNSPLYYQYSIKYARMRLDSNDQEIVDAGRSDLQDLSVNAKNPLQDEALYQLGRYYLDIHDELNAQQVLGRLLDRADEFKDSPWIVLAREASQAC